MSIAPPPRKSDSYAEMHAADRPALILCRIWVLCPTLRIRLPYMRARRDRHRPCHAPKTRSTISDRNGCHRQSPQIGRQRFVIIRHGYGTNVEFRIAPVIVRLYMFGYIRIVAILKSQSEACVRPVHEKRLSVFARRFEQRSADFALQAVFEL